MKFSPGREERIKKEKLFYIVFFTITAFIGLGFFITSAFGIPHSTRTIVGELALVSYELIIAVDRGGQDCIQRVHRKHEAHHG